MSERAEEFLVALDARRGATLTDCTACGKCVEDRGIEDDLVEDAAIGCFPDLHKALGGAGIDQVITL